MASDASEKSLPRPQRSYHTFHGAINLPATYSAASISFIANPTTALLYVLLILSFLTSCCPTLAETYPRGVHDIPKDGLSNNVIPRQNDAPNQPGSGGSPRTTGEQASTWTFSNPGASYMDFSPQLREGKNQHYSLSFRTRRANSLLLHQHVTGPGGKSISPVLSQYQLFVELHQGSLRAGMIVDQYQDILTAGKALNNDEWHTVDVVVDVQSGEMRVTLDGELTKETIKAYTWGNAAELLLWSHLKPVVSLGDTRMKSSIVEFQPFVGCLRDIQYARPEGYLTRPTFNITESVAEGCLDRCVGDRSCGPGRCINLYTPGVLCDCHGTDFEGPRCDLEATTTVTFRGYEWINYQLYEPGTGRLFTDNLRIALEFKTERDSGVLLYAVGGNPYHNHVTVSIYSGEVHVSVSFQEDDLTFSGGIGLDDGRWHNLTLQHRGKSVVFYLDGMATEKKVSKGDHYLSLDPGLFIGGGDNFVQTKGLPVTQSFVGCLRSVYINEVSVLYELIQGNPRSSYNGGQLPKYGCSSVAEVPISFPRSTSLLRWSSRERKQNLSIEFKMRSFHHNSIVLSVELVSRRGSGSDFDFGTVQLWVVNKFPVLQFIPSFKEAHTRQNLTVPLMVSDGQMHDVVVTLTTSKVKLQVDGMSVYSKRYYRLLENRGTVILGYSLDQIDRRYGFVGCMQGIKIQGQRLDAIALMESDDAVGLLLDGCQLVDHCAKDNICQHESVCLSDWDGVHCLCNEDHYEGKACHFAKYAASCEEYYRMGYRTNGIYLIDVDGSGPLDHTHVHCEMGGHVGSGRVRRMAVQGGVTRLQHNFERNTTVRAPWLPDLQYHLKYRDMSRAHLAQLTQQSEQCEQYLEYGCQNSPLRLSQRTWFKSSSGEIVDYIGSHTSGYCTCPQHLGCEGQHCYCDLNQDNYRYDNGYNTDRRQLPLMEMTFIQSKPSGIAHMTLGPLKCWGSASQPFGQSVTITQAGNFLKLRPWRSGELRLNFKTHSANAVLLYQAEGETPETTGKLDLFYIIIDSAHSMTVHFRRDGRSVSRQLQSQRRLNEGNWHSLVLEHDHFNLRITLDSNRLMVDLPQGFEISKEDAGANGETNLYLGGVPDRLPVTQMGLNNMPGFTGCLYGFVYNDSPLDLADLVDGSMSGVSKGCMSSCWPNPCQNGGVCQESWISYTCRCANTWAHIGENCEIDINKDAVTFSGLPGSSLMFDVKDKEPHALLATVVLSFRTLLTEALLFYIHDHLGNFVQLELTNAQTVVISYNNANQIIREAVRTVDVLNDGDWKQVVAENYFNFTRLMVQSHSKVIEVNRGGIQMYRPDPYTGNFDQQTVFIPRPSLMPEPFIHAYVGGVKDGASTTPPLTGCVRGVRVGDFVFRLQDKARSLKNDTVVTPACEKGCKKLACHNNGFCVEKWRDAQFECNCDVSGFSGRRCEIEPSVLVKGSTVVRHSFELPLTERYSLSERLTFRFKSDRRRPLAKDKQIVLVYIASTKDQDYILIKFDPSGNIVLETNQGDGIYRMKVSGQFEDDRPHDFSYVRDGSSMHVEVDGSEEVSINYPDYPLNNIDTIYIGGYLRDALDFLDLANFSGCISNTAFIPKEGSSRTLHTLRDLYTEEKGISVFGEETTSCSTSEEDTSTTQAPPSAAHIITPGTYMEATMPPWVDGELRIVTLSAVPSENGPATSVPLIPSVTSTKSTGNDTYPVLFNTPNEPVGDLTIIIAVIVVALLLVISLCLILVLVRMRKRRGDYLVKKEKGGAVDGNVGGAADMELRQPLNNHHTNLGASSCSSRGSPATTGGPQTATLRRVVHPPTVPSDHLAKLDEFSMISVALGPRVPKTEVHPPEEARKRYGEGTYPLADGETEFISPIYNARKQRPASSISEVLEEMERRQTPLPNGSPERPGRLHGEGELEWDSQADASAPFRNEEEEEALVSSPLLPPIPDELEESRLSSFSGHPSSSLGGDSSYQKYPGPLESSGSPAGSSHMNSTAECNGDSGYEAESRREATEDDITPETLADEIADIHLHPERPPKLYSFMVPDLRVQHLNDPYSCDSRSPAGIFTESPSADGGAFLDNSSGGDLCLDNNSLRRDAFKNSNSSGFHMEESPDLSRMSARDRLLQEGTEV